MTLIIREPDAQAKVLLCCPSLARRASVCGVFYNFFNSFLIMIVWQRSERMNNPGFIESSDKSLFFLTFDRDILTKGLQPIVVSSASADKLTHPSIREVLEQKYWQIRWGHHGVEERFGRERQHRVTVRFQQPVHH